MGAKVNCKKGYNASNGYVEFKKTGDTERCPVSDAVCCESCGAKSWDEN